MRHRLLWMRAIAALGAGCAIAAFAGVASAATPAPLFDIAENAPDAASAAALTPPTDAGPSAPAVGTESSGAPVTLATSSDAGSTDSTLAPVPFSATPLPVSAPVPPAPPATTSPPVATDSTNDSSGPFSLVEKRKASKNPFRNSTFLLEQSISTQTLGVGEAPLSYMPTYEWWLSFQPRYYFTDHLYLAGRFDYFKEFTNSDSGPGDAGGGGAATTAYREDDFGDLRTTLIYESWLNKGKTIKLSGGPRFLWPTSKQSQGEGIYVQAGVLASFLQKLAIHDASAPYFDDIHYRLFAWYNHPFSRATTPTNPDFQYIREDTDGQSFLSDQLAGTTLVDHDLILLVEASLQITPRVDFDLDLYDINQWHYAPPSNQCVVLLGGQCAVIPRSSDDVLFGQATWFVASVNWDVFDQLSLGLGYYNSQNELTLTGQNRSIFGSDNIWWSPNARFFFDITANLDAIYDSLSPKGSVKKAAQEARDETIRQLSNMRF